jgi:hypothetical protein
MAEYTEKEDKVVKPYFPNKKEKETLTMVYKEIQEFIDQRNQTWRQFNDRTLIGFINDSEKRVQGYVPTRESQGKDENASNVFNQVTRNKLKAIIASVASTPPEIRYKAISEEDGGMDLRRAEIIENLVNFSRYKNNPETEIFWEAWNCAAQGTIVKYDGYLKTTLKRKFIKSYDFATGDMEFEEKEVTVNDECIDEFVPLNELYIKNFYIDDIQKQPALAWVRYVDEQAASDEWGKYKNWKYVNCKAVLAATEGSQETFFTDQWADRVGDNDYEIIKYYNKSKDRYVVIINGVVILDAPMLWGRKDKKYPFSKTIFEPFSNKDFFYGNSLANANMDSQDTINAFYNMAIDKTNRSLNPPLLIGAGNKDLMEFEDEFTGMETKIYLNDVNQAKYQDIPGLNNSELAMIKWVSSGMDLGTVDETQQGVASRGVTAREIVIANENAKRLKGLFFMFLTDLWVQKTKIRILNILMNYTIPQVKEIVGDEGKTIYEERFRTFNIENSEFPDGSTGILSVQIAGPDEPLPSPGNLDLEEEYGRAKTGEAFNKIVMRSSYLDDFDYDVQVIPDSIFQKDSAESQAIIEQKLKIMATMFPEKFMANMDILFDDFLRAYNDSPDKYVGMPPEPEAPIAEPGSTPAVELPQGGGNEVANAPTQPQAGGEEDLQALRDTVNQALKQ